MIASRSYLAPASSEAPISFSKPVSLGRGPQQDRLSDLTVQRCGRNTHFTNDMSNPHILRQQGVLALTPKAAGEPLDSHLKLARLS
jgi:hypothetical protein